MKASIHVILVLLLLAGGCQASREETIVVRGLTMEPTLSDGQMITIEYDRLPGRHDIVLYKKWWVEGEELAIGRVIGLPGERISINGPTVQVDGATLHEPYVETPANYVREFNLLSDEYAILQDRRDIGDDSHSRGPAPAGAIIGSASGY